MQRYKHKADGARPEERSAAKIAVEVQDAVNLRAIVSAFLHHLDALREIEIAGDLLNNHPVALAFVSKLVSLTRLNVDTREGDALAAIDKIAAGESVEYDIIPL